MNDFARMQYEAARERAVRIIGMLICIGFGFFCAHIVFEEYTAWLFRFRP